MTGPAHDFSAEQALLGALLLNNGGFAEINGLQAHHFYRPVHQTIFESALQMFSGGGQVDAITLAAELDKSGKLLRIGGAPYLHTLLEMIPTTANIASYAHLIIDRWKLRRLGELGAKYRQLSEGASLDEVPEALDAARHFLDEVDGEAQSNSMGFMDLYESWKGWMEVDRPAIETPWPELNDRIGGGLHRQHLYVIGARSGTGKTILLTNAALYAAQLHRRVMFFSLELPKEVLMGRILSAGARVPYKEIVGRMLTPDTKKKLDQWVDASGYLQSHLYIDDSCAMTIEDIARECRAKKRTDGVDAICIDYAQRMKVTNAKADREQQVAHIFEEAKTLARETDAAVVLAAQLNRKIESERRLPLKSDFRESGAAEQEADVALILTRPPEATAQPVVNFTLVKNRLGVEETFPILERFHQQRLGS